MLRELPRQGARHPIRGIAAPDARRAEYAHRRTDGGQRIEALDELAHDAQRPPGIGLQEGGVGSLLEQLLVLGGPFFHAAHDHGSAAVSVVSSVGHWPPLLDRSDIGW